MKRPSGFKLNWLIRAGLLPCAVRGALCLSSCAELSRDMGLVEPTDLEQREGPGGTTDNPTVLDPFKKCTLVMAGGECRFFQLKLPQQWYWKLSLTVVNRQEGKRGKLTAQILPIKPPWDALRDLKSGKAFELGRESIAGTIGVGTGGPSRVAFLPFWREGPPLRWTLESQISPALGILNPDFWAQSPKNE